MLAEFPASRRILFFGKRPYFVSLPKMQLCIHYLFIPFKQNFITKDFKLCFVKNKNTIMVPPFPNIHEDLEICCPVAQGKTVDDLIAEQFTRFFSSKFNTSDLLEAMFYYYPNIFEHRQNIQKCIEKYMKEWMEKTKNNPKWIPKDFKKFDSYKDFATFQDCYWQ